MKKTIILLFLVASNTIHAQEIIKRSDSNNLITLFSSVALIQMEPKFCSANAGVIITKDTVTSNIYMVSFFYKSPKEILLDTTAEIEIRFADGSLFTYNNCGALKGTTQKDSTASLQILASYNCMRKMTKIPVSEISFITPLYTHTIVIEDQMKLFLPNLARLILDKTQEEYLPIVELERSLNVPPIVFDSKGNKQLDKKYLGRYSGEWYADEYLYTYDLYIKPDTSYIVWYIINDPYESLPKRIKTQVLNIRTITENNTLIMDVCYEADKAGYTDGRRSFYLKLSENGKVLYGETSAFNKRFGKLYGIKKRKHRR